MTMTAKRCKGPCGKMITSGREMCLACSGDIPGGRESLTPRVTSEPKIGPEKMDRQATGQAILTALESLTVAVNALTRRVETVETNARETRASVAPILPTLRTLVERLAPMLESAQSGQPGSAPASLPGADGAPVDPPRVGGGLDGTEPEPSYAPDVGARFLRLDLD